MNSPRSLRTTELAKEFARQGHNVKVITPRENEVHDEFEDKFGVEIQDLGKPNFKQIELKGSGLKLLLRRFVRRISSLLFEYPDIQYVYKVSNTLNNENPLTYDLLISIAAPYPIHWGVATEWDKKNPENNPAKNWVADCGDPYYFESNDSFRKPFYFAWVEKWFMKKADFITVPIQGALNAYFTEFHDKIKVIPQGFEFPELEESDIINYQSKPTFAYFGNIGSYRHYAEPFLKYLNEINEDFHFYIFTKEKDIYEKNLNQKTINKCTFFGYKNRKELLSALQNIDFLVHFPYKENTQRSLKLIDYAYLQKPVLSYRATEADKKKVRDFLGGNFSEKESLENIDQYRIENVCQQFLGLIKEE